MKCVDCKDYKECRMNSDLRRKRHRCNKAKDIYVLTNADNIRSMTDEELAEWMAECNAYGERAIASQWMPWLKQPYKEDT